MIHLTQALGAAYDTANSKAAASPVDSKTTGRIAPETEIIGGVGAGTGYDGMHRGNLSA
jgi:hypothetical protein